MRAMILLIGLGLPAVALAQEQSAPSGYALAPWWMSEAVTPAIGLAQTQLPANRASIRATFQVVNESSSEATRLAAEKVRTLGAQLSAFGADKARVETTFNMDPIYQQYRDRSGDLIANERADKIERYDVFAQVVIEVRDLSVLEDVYSTVLAARPTRTDSVAFNLVADNATTTSLFQSAVADARERARRAAQATGAQLGPVKVIDASGRACTAAELLAGATVDEEASAVASIDRKRRAATPVDSITADDVVVVGARARQRAAVAALRPEDMRLPLQAPMMTLSTRACVIFGLAGQ